MPSAGEPPAHASSDTQSPSLDCRCRCSPPLAASKEALRNLDEIKGAAGCPARLSKGDMRGCCEDGGMEPLLPAAWSPALITALAVDEAVAGSTTSVLSREPQCADRLHDRSSLCGQVPWMSSGGWMVMGMENRRREPGGICEHTAANLCEQTSADVTYDM
eukprot:1156301-Pelagomonas_calceolata.AAC.2